MACDRSWRRQSPWGQGTQTWIGSEDAAAAMAKGGAKSSRSRGTGRRQSDAGGQPAGTAPVRNPRNPRNRHRAGGHRGEVDPQRQGQPARWLLPDPQWRAAVAQRAHLTHTHAGSYFNHDPLRTRKLLAHRREIDKLRGLVDQKGPTLIPSTFTSRGPGSSSPSD